MGWNWSLGSLLGHSAVSSRLLAAVMHTLGITVATEREREYQYCQATNNKMGISTIEILFSILWILLAYATHLPRPQAHSSLAQVFHWPMTHGVVHNKPQYHTDQLCNSTLQQQFIVIEFYFPILEHFCPFCIQTAQMGLTLPRWGLILPSIPPPTPDLYSAVTLLWVLSRICTYTTISNQAPKQPFS